MLVLTLFPFDNLHIGPEIDITFFDKIVHMCLFGTHAFLLAGYLTKRNSIPPDNYRYLAGAILLSFLFGLFIEITQYFIPERSFELLDLVANFFGILLGILIFYVKFNFFTH